MTSSDKNPDLQLRLEISGPPGAELAAERRRRGLTLEHVAHELKLSRTMLRQIEADEMSHLPPAFCRGYISNYSKLLGLDPQPLIANMAPPESSELRDVLPSPRSGQNVERVMRFATYLLVTTVIVPPLVYFFVERGVDWFEPKPTAETSVIAPSDAVTRTAVDLDQGVIPPRRTETLAASALPLSSMSSVSSSAADVQAATDASLENVPPDPRTTLELELLADSWVEIQDASGERLEFDLLRAGQQRQYLGLAPFELLIGRGNAVELKLDGELAVFEGHDSDGVARFEIQQPSDDSLPDAG